jgi:hypothetical protein
MTAIRLSLLGLFLVAAPWLVGACGGGMQVNCTASFVNGIVITLKDPGGAPICDATITAVDGTYSETLKAGPGCTYTGAGERAGVYDVTIEKSGFKTQMIQIGVTKDECHVHTEQRNLTLSTAP